MISFFASLTLFARMERQIAALPRWAVLLLFAVPFAIAEPMKIIALLMIARGQFALGVATLAIAYLATFLIVERIYHAGRGKLLTYRWFAWAMRYVRMAKFYYDAIKTKALAIARPAQAWIIRLLKPSR